MSHSSCFRSALLTLLGALGFSFLAASLCAAPRGGPYEPGEVLVKFRPAPPGRAALAPAGLAGARVQKTFPRLGWQLLKLPAAMDVPQGVEYFRARADVLHAEPNYHYELYATPNDPKYSKLWGLEKIGAPQAWDKTTGSADLVVAVVDTGLDYDHPDLAANVWTNPGEIPGNNLDDDGNGYKDDLHGIDVVNNDGDPMDDEGHGTHVAGTIGGVGNNGLGVAGVNWSVKLISVQIFTADHYATTAAIADGYEYLLGLKEKGVNLRVINNSWGGPFPSLSLKDAFCSAGDAGILSVCAAGNDHHDNESVPTYPAGYDCDGIIAVAASNEDDLPAYFTNYGATTVDLAAPGEGTVSTYKGGPFYTSFNGTSMAAPHVAGAAALLLARKPSLTVAQLKALLMDTVDKLPAWNGRVVSDGRLNVARAMGNVNAAGLQSESVAGVSSTAPVPLSTSRSGPSPQPSPLGGEREPWQSVAGSLGSAGQEEALPAVLPLPAGEGRGEGEGDSLQTTSLDSPLAAPQSTAPTPNLTCVSRSTLGRFGNGSSDQCAISADGRFIAFVSAASNFAPTQLPGSTQVFLHDRQTGATVRISQNSAGVEGNGNSESVAMSADGRFISFHSSASNLVAGDGNNHLDIFLYDRVNGTLELFSRRANGGAANSDSIHPSVSADGNFIAYASYASNLVSSDSNETADIFVVDRLRKNAPVRASVSTSGTQADGMCDAPALSGDGKLVAFHSVAANLVTGDANGAYDVVVRDLGNKRTERLTSTPAGQAGKGDSAYPSISGDGRFVAFASAASDLVSGDANGRWDIFLRDRQQQTTLRLSVSSGGAEGNEDSLDAVISAEGRFVVFESGATTLFPGKNDNRYEICQFDRLTGKLSRLAQNALGFVGLDNSFWPQSSADGRFVAFASWAFNLVPGDGNAYLDVFVLDRGDVVPDLMIRNAGEVPYAGSGLYGVQVVQRAGQTVNSGAIARYELKLENSGPTAAFVVTAPPPRAGWQINFFDAASGGNAITAAVTGAGWTTGSLAPGTSVVFRLEVTPVSAVAADHALEVMVSARATAGGPPLDAVRAVTVRPFVPPDLISVSRAASGLPGTDNSRSPGLSADGRFVVFTSDADLLVPNDDNFDLDVFVFDRLLQTIEAASSGADGKPAERRSENGSISRDGRFVAFQSRAAELVNGDLNEREDILVKDRLTGTVQRVSVASDGTEANGGSEFARLSGNGQFVLFQSMARNLGGLDENKAWDVFLHERATGLTKCLSLTPSGRTGNAESTTGVITPDGRFVVFESYASDLAPNDDNGDKDLFLYDRSSQTLELITRAPDGHSGDGASSGPSSTDDGRYILFSSGAENLAPPPAGGSSGIHLYDRITRTITRLKPAAPGLPSEVTFSAVNISPDGRWICLNSASPGAVAGDASHFTQAFLYERLTGALTPVSVTRAGLAGTEHSLGGSFSADGRFLAFRSFALNLLAENAPEASQVFVWDRARFQPDELVRREGGSSFRGDGVFSGAGQSVEQPVAPGSSATFRVAIKNAADFADGFLVTGPAGDGANWQVQYFDAASGADVTAAVTGAGWPTGELAAGASRELRLVVRSLRASDLPQNFSLTATSTTDAARTDAVLAIAQPDNDGDTLPDSWERAMFSSTAIATGASDFDRDGLSDLGEYLAGTDPKNRASLLTVASVVRAGENVLLRWSSEPNRFYTVERTTDLSAGFSVVSANLAATAPENILSVPAASGGAASFYRVRVEPP